jgi:salicylate hydroxylase
MTPHQGSGAGQAIEVRFAMVWFAKSSENHFKDAYLLATVLGHTATTKDTLGRALHIYDTIRRPAALQVMEKSRLNGHYFTFYGLDLDGLDPEKQLFRLQKLGNTVAKNWEWAWTTSIDESLDAALRMLEF